MDQLSGLDPIDLAAQVLELQQQLEKQKNKERGTFLVSFQRVQMMIEFILALAIESTYSPMLQNCTSNWCIY
jgi:hypothetical protein